MHVLIVKYLFHKAGLSCLAFSKNFTRLDSRYQMTTVVSAMRSPSN